MMRYIYHGNASFIAQATFGIKLGKSISIAFFATGIANAAPTATTSRFQLR